MNGATILICDDNETVHQTLQLYLMEAGFQVRSAFDGISALDIIQQEKIDLLILDIMLPKMFGTEVCRQIRKTSDLPIIILSAKVDEADRIVGLELGADDYVTKPFSPKEVVTRVKTVLRRTMPRAGVAKFLQVGKLRVNPKAYEVTVDDQSIKMTPREVELLAFLMNRAGEVASREEILDAVWGIDYYGDIRAVDTLLARIRSKIHEHRANVSFRSIYGVGYMIEERHE